MTEIIWILTVILKGLGTTSKWFCWSVLIGMRTSVIHLNTVSSSKLKKYTVIYIMRIHDIKCIYLSSLYKHSCPTVLWCNSIFFQKLLCGKYLKDSKWFVFAINLPSCSRIGIYKTLNMLHFPRDPTKSACCLDHGSYQFKFHNKLWK